MSATRQSGQAWIIDRMQVLNYEGNLEGVCFGFAHMALQTILAEDLETFMHRMVMLIENNPRILAARIDEVRIKIKGEQALNQQEKAILEIPAFLKGIEVYQKAQAYDWESNDIAMIASFSGVYKLPSFLNYFKIIQSCFEQGDTPPSLILYSPKHVILVTYRPMEDKWLLIDSEQPDYITKLFSTESIGEMVLNALSSARGNSIFTTKIYGTKKTEKSLLEQVQRWQSNINWSELHRVTMRNAMSTDHLGYSWLYAAALNNEYQTVNELLNNGADPNKVMKNLSYSLLGSVVQRGFTDIAERLIAAGANAALALMIVIKDNLLTTLKELIKAGINIHTGIKFEETTVMTPLILAIKWEKLTIATELLEHKDIGPSLTKPYLASRSELVSLARNTNNEDAETRIKKVLLLKQADSDGYLSIQPAEFATLLGQDDIAALIKSKLPNKTNFFQSTYQHAVAANARPFRSR